MIFFFQQKFSENAVLMNLLELSEDVRKSLRDVFYPKSGFSEDRAVCTHCGVTKKLPTRNGVIQRTIYPVDALEHILSSSCIFEGIAFKDRRMDKTDTEPGRYLTLGEVKALCARAEVARPPSQTSIPKTHGVPSARKQSTATYWKILRAVGAFFNENDIPLSAVRSKSWGSLCGVFPGGVQIDSESLSFASAELKKESAVFLPRIMRDPNHSDGFFSLSFDALQVDGL